jgi:asparagine synthase (glutamine-hydrolysing)
VEVEALAREWTERGQELLGEVGGHHGLVVVDRDRGEVTLARGPHGSDPVYYRMEGRSLVWGDRVASVARGLERRRFSRAALRDVLNYRWCLGRETLVDGVLQTRTGEAVTIGADGSGSARRVHDIRFRPEPDGGDLDVWADRATEALTATLAASLDGADRPTVLLSGGIDSSILAALALRVRPDVLAVTPTWRDHFDPELDRARLYAEHLGIDHRVVPIPDEEIPGAVRWMARAMEQPPRTDWAFALERCLAGLDVPVDVVVHGMAADTLFGYSQVVFTREYRRKRRLVEWIPGRRLLAGVLPDRPGRMGRIRRLLTRPLEEAFLRSNRTSGRSPLHDLRPDLFGDGLPGASFLEVAWDPDHPFEERAQRSGLFGPGQAQLIQLSRAGEAHGARFVLPFVESPALDVALQLPPSLRWVDRRTKPVLRRISERLFDPEWARRPKLAFPMPIAAWRRGCLAPWFRHRLGPGSWAREVFGDAVDTLETGGHESLLWTLAYLDEIAESLDLDQDGDRIAE